jgi:hypothetical protein
MITENSIRQPIPEVYGVRNPRHNAAAGNPSASRVNHVGGNGCSVPCARRLAAAVSLRITNAPPAAPAGNMENSLCIGSNATGVYVAGKRQIGGSCDPSFDADEVAVRVYAC